MLVALFNAMHIFQINIKLSYSPSLLFKFIKRICLSTLLYFLYTFKTMTPSVQTNGCGDNAHLIWLSNQHGNHTRSTNPLRRPSPPNCFRTTSGDSPAEVLTITIAISITCTSRAFVGWFWKT